MGSEQRRTARLAASFPCELRWRDEVSSGRISDISMGGALVTEVDNVPPREALVSIYFELTDEEVTLKVELKSVVAHVQEGETSQVGLEFREPSRQLWPRLTPVLQSLRSDESDSHQTEDAPENSRVEMAEESSGLEECIGLAQSLVDITRERQLGDAHTTVQLCGLAENVLARFLHHYRQRVNRSGNLLATLGILAQGTVQH